MRCHGRHGSRACSLMSSSPTFRRGSSCPTACGRSATTLMPTGIRSAGASRSATGAGRTRQAGSGTTWQRSDRLQSSAVVRRGRPTPCGWYRTQTLTRHRSSSSVRRGSSLCLPPTRSSSAGSLGWATLKSNPTISQLHPQLGLKPRGFATGWRRDFRSTFQKQESWPALEIRIHLARRRPILISDGARLIARPSGGPRDPLDTRVGGPTLAERNPLHPPVFRTAIRAASHGDSLRFLPEKTGWGGI